MVALGLAIAVGEAQLDIDGGVWCGRDSRGLRVPAMEITFEEMMVLGCVGTGYGASFLFF